MKKELINEEWVLIPGFKKYSVNKKGEVKGVKGGVLKSCKDRYGYLRVNVTRDDGKRSVVRVHRLVALTFCPNKNEHKNNQVDHINGIKTDNRAENLEWVSNQENQIRAVKMGLVKQRMGEKHHMAILKKEEVLDIYTSYDTHINLSKKFNISTSNVMDIRHGRIWCSVTNGIDNSNQILWLKEGVRGLTIESVRDIFTKDGLYDDIAKEYGTSRNMVSLIKRSKKCDVFTKDLIEKERR